LVNQLAEFPVFHRVALRTVPAHGRHSAFSVPCGDRAFVILSGSTF
jgi:hypothetical protein